MTPEFHRDGRVTLSNPDPIIEKVVGYERFYLAADLGQANDFTAVCLLRDRRIPIYGTSTRQVLGPRERVVVFADRFRGVSYVDIVGHLLELMQRPSVAGRVELSIDATGLGRVVHDMMVEKNIPHHAVQMTTGQNWSRNGQYISVGKTLLVETLSVMFSSGELTFADGLTLRREIEEDLASFTITTSAAGNQIITQSRSAAGHGDLGISLAIAAFTSQHLKRGVIGQHKLTGYWG